MLCCVTLHVGIDYGDFQVHLENRDVETSVKSGVVSLLWDLVKVAVVQFNKVGKIRDHATRQIDMIYRQTKNTTELRGLYESLSNLESNVQNRYISKLRSGKSIIMKN